MAIFSPGLGMGRDSSMFNIEKLVESGYVVVTIGHIYETRFTVLPDGDIVERADATNELTDEVIRQLITMRKDDILFVMDELKILNDEDNILNNKFNLSKIGLIGHSLGGAAQFEVYKVDNRIKALVMLDGSMQCIDLSEEIKIGEKNNTPLLNLRNGYVNYEERIKRCIELNKAKLDGEMFKKRLIAEHETSLKMDEGQAYLQEYVGDKISLIKLKNSEHMTFTDWNIINNELEEEGIISARRAHEIINDVVISFLNQNVCKEEGQYDKLIQGDKYEELTEI